MKYGLFIMLVPTYAELLSSLNYEVPFWPSHLIETCNISVLFIVHIQHILISFLRKSLLIAKYISFDFLTKFKHFLKGCSSLFQHLNWNNNNFVIKYTTLYLKINFQSARFRSTGSQNIQFKKVLIHERKLKNEWIVNVVFNVIRNGCWLSKLLLKIIEHFWMQDWHK